MNVDEIAKVLKKFYGADIEFNLKDNFYLYGSLRGKTFEIGVPAGAGVVSVAVPLREEALLDELIICFNEIMQSTPICKYNFADEKGNPCDITVEWSQNSLPEYRMQNVISGAAFRDGCKAINLIEYYMTDKRKLELAQMNKFSPVLFKGYHISDENLYQHFADCSEADLALILKTLINFWNMYYSNAWHDILPEPSNIEEAAKEAWRQAEKRFLNSDNPASADDKINAWAKWWMEYFTPDVHLAYMKKRIAGENVSEFYPEGSWSDLITKTEPTPITKPFK